MMLSVVFSTDENYLFYTAVAIASMALSANEGTVYKVYILCDEGFRDEERILSHLQRTFSNILIHKITVDGNLFKNVFINNSHVSKAAFYRIVIADVIEEDKCIYLDADTLVLEDLNALWETDIDDYYIAGCRDIWIDWLSPAEREQRREKTKIVSLDRYVNSGVLLFNLKKIRDDKMNVMLKEHLVYDYPFEDQDILNICCYDHILILPAKWNRFNDVYGSIDIMQGSEMSMDGFLGNGGIIHFTSKVGKPWETYRAWKCDKWWEVAECFANTQAYIRTKSHVEIWSSQHDFFKLCDYLKSYSRVVIWGYTQQNMLLYELIAKRFSKTQIFFTDKDMNKQGLNYQGAKVLTPAEAYEIMNGCLYIITSRRWNKEICDGLTTHGILRSNMYLFYNKSKEYYRMLQPKYYEEELQDISMKEGIRYDSIKRDGEIIASGELQRKYYMSDWILKG